MPNSEPCWLAGAAWAQWAAGWYSPVPFCSAVCLLHALQEVDFCFCYPYCCCRYCPSSQLLRVGCCQQSCCFCLSYLWPPGLLLPSRSWSWFCSSDTTRGFISARHQKNSKVAFLTIWISAARDSPSPPILHPLAKALYICPITYSWSSRSIPWKVHLLKPDSGFVWIASSFLAHLCLVVHNHKAHWGWEKSWLSTMLLGEPFLSLGAYGSIARRNTRLGCPIPTEQPQCARRTKGSYLYSTCSWKLVALTEAFVADSQYRSVHFWDIPAPCRMADLV